MEFKNKHTGVILKITNEFVLEQIKKSNDYEEIKIEKKSSKKKEQ